MQHGYRHTRMNLWAACFYFINNCPGNFLRSHEILYKQMGRLYLSPRFSLLAYHAIPVMHCIHLATHAFRSHTRWGFGTLLLFAIYFGDPLF